jgi:cob(I)alamin adenosyltransferase
MNGYVQVYTGEGKGKTTAAFGLSMRAAGAGLSVFIGQFLKKGHFSEHSSFERFEDLVTIHQYGTPGFLFGDPTDEHIEAAVSGLREIEHAAASGDYDLIVMDEVNVALHHRLIASSQVLDIIKNKLQKVELVLTGRNAPQEIIDAADLVTEMRPIKHYYDRGIEARKGIEL